MTMKGTLFFRINIRVDNRERGGKEPKGNLKRPTEDYRKLQRTVYVSTSITSHCCPPPQKNKNKCPISI